MSREKYCIECECTLPCSSFPVLLVLNLLLPQNHYLGRSALKILIPLVPNSNRDIDLGMSINGSNILRSSDIELGMAAGRPQTTKSDKCNEGHAEDTPPAAVTFPDGGKEACIVRNTYHDLCP